MSSRAKAWLGAVCVTIGAGFGVAAVVSYDWAILWTAFAVCFGAPGLGLLAEATDPRHKPNPRTAEAWAQRATLAARTEQRRNR